MAMDLQRLYDNIKKESQKGTILLSNVLFPNVSELLDLLSISSVTLMVNIISDIIQQKSFKIEGHFSMNNSQYTYTLTITTQENKYDYQFNSILNIEGTPLLQAIYPLPDVMTADTFYTMPLSLFNDVYITKAEITGDTEGNQVMPSFIMGLFYTDECLLWKRYKEVLPSPGTEMIFTGTIENPFKNTEKGETLYEIQTTYTKAVSLPFMQLLQTKEANLTISHFLATDDSKSAVAGWERKFSTVCRVYWKGRVDLPVPGFNDIWVSYNLFDHGTGFDIYTTFGESGMGIENIFQLIQALSGKSEMTALPEWFVLKNITLQNIGFRMEKEIAIEPIWPGTRNNTFLGVAMLFHAALPQIPIPFFNSDPTIYLKVMWDSLDIGGFLSIEIGFFSSWNGYHFDISMVIPSLVFKAQLNKEKSKQYLANTPMFPGFSALSVEDISLEGSLKEGYYYLSFLFGDSTKQVIPLNQISPSLDFVTGTAFYTPEGFGFGIELGFTMLGAKFIVSGQYEKDEEGQMLTLAGGLYSPLRLVDVINNILGTSIDSSKLEFTINSMYFMYKVLLPAGSENLSAGKKTEITFFCNIHFAWDIIKLKVDSEFHFFWSNEKKEFKIKALLYFYGFEVGASFLIDIPQSGEAIFKDPEFSLEFAKHKLTAKQITVETHKALQIDIPRMNLGELIEELFRVILPNDSWYLPWPFKILKQFSIPSIQLIIDDEKKEITASIDINLKILFFTIEKAVVHYTYNDGDSDFFLDLVISGMIQNDQVMLGRTTVNDSFLHGLNLLKNIFPPLPGLGKSVFNLKYLAIGQHIHTDVPTDFDEESMQVLFNNIKKSMKLKPVVDPNTNWILAIDLELLKSIGISIFMCDPNFYGIFIEVKEGSAVTKALVGLKVIVLYSKITETIGMFYARFILPERLRLIDIGAVQVRLGEVAVAIYTNGNFKIDLGFPYNRDFSRSFGLTYTIFSGKGGFYFASLNGSTSKRIPEAKRGHFDTVIELGIGISAGVGREIRMGPLKASAYIQVVGIFEGVFASYIRDNESKSDEIYYKVNATLGVFASIYGEVDFVLIKISFAINISFMATITMESYRKTLLDIEANVSVNASIKILFIRINFSFQFKWKASFEIGKNEIAPWETVEPRRALDKLSSAPLILKWKEDLVLARKESIYAEMAIYFSMDNVSLNGNSNENLKHKIAFLPLLHGYDKKTLDHVDYADDMKESSFVLIVQAFLIRAVQSLGRHPEYQFTYEDIKELLDVISESKTFEEGFTIEQIYCFMENNFNLHFMFSEMELETDIEGIAFPMPPSFTFTWTTKDLPDEIYDIAKEPAVDNQFLENVKKYYEQLSMDGYQKTDKVEETKEQSASSYLFRDYFYMITRIALSQVLGKWTEEESLTISHMIEFITEKDCLNSICGMTSKFLFGGLRVPVDNIKTESLYTFSKLQFDAISPTDDLEEVLHTFEMKKSDDIKWIYLQKSVTASRIDTKKPLLGVGTDADFLYWELRSKDLKYPKGSLAINMPVLEPYYAWKPVTLGLKNPSMVLDGKQSRRIYEISNHLPDNFEVVLRDKNDEFEKITSFTKGYIIYVPITYVKGNTYSVGFLGYDAMDALYRAVKNITEETTEIKAFRHTTAFDKEEQEGWLPLELENIFLFRTNLCLESEKPIVEKERIASFSATVPAKNSGRIKENTKTFLSLLKDASLVNGRGYYVTCDLPDFVLEDNATKIILWVPCEKEADGILIDHGFNEDEKTPVIITSEQYSVPLYKPGNIGFHLDRNEPDDEIDSQFQMLQYKIRKDATFSCDSESLPITAESKPTGQWVYTQVVPAYRFVQGEKEDPYKGITTTSQLNLDFSLIDILGNQTAWGISQKFEYGYTDPLISPGSYPLTQCFYTVSKVTSGVITFEIHFSYKSSEDGTKDKENLRIAYWQLNQPGDHVSIEAKILNDWILLDKSVLLTYLEELYEKGNASEIIYTISERLPSAEAQKFEVSLRIKREPKYLAKSLQGKAESLQVIGVTCIVSANEDAFQDMSVIAKNDQNGDMYIVKKQQAVLGDAYYATLKPLSQTLISLKNSEVHDLDSNAAYVSFMDIDLELWMDTFLEDFEYYISAESPLTTYAHGESLERLLQLKEDLSTAIAKDMQPILTTKSEEHYRLKAVECFVMNLRRNLYTGRKTHVVAVMETISSPNFSFLGSVKSDDEEAKEVIFSAGKIKKDGLLPIVVNHNQITEQKEVHCFLEYTLTDWEECESVSENKYKYLTLLEKDTITKKLDIPLPYKYYPDLPILLNHTFKGADNFFGWEYIFDFSHSLAVQDTVFVEISVPGFRMANIKVRSLPEALADYIYVKEAIRGAFENNIVEKGVKRFIESGERILMALTANMGFAKSAQGYFLRFSLERKNSTTFILEGDTSMLCMRLQDMDGIWHELKRNGNEFVMPEMNPLKPYVFQFVYSDLDIRYQNVLNTKIYVRRNQNISQINPLFVYETPVIQFPKPLSPSLRYEKEFSAGNWTQKGFCDFLLENGKGFSGMNLEIKCHRLISRGKTKDIYTNIPIMYIPFLEISTSTDENLKDVFTYIKEWLNEHTSNANPHVFDIQMYVTFFKGERNLAEITSVIFRVY